VQGSLVFWKRKKNVRYVMQRRAGARSSQHSTASGTLAEPLNGTRSESAPTWGTLLSLLSMTACCVLRVETFEVIGTTT
jgi:hypothetical protein